MKILQVVSGLPGVSTPSFMIFVSSQIESLRKLGLDIDILNLSAAGPGSWVKYLCGIFEIRKRINTNKYDLIHAHYSYCGWISLFQPKVPVIVSFLGSDLLGSRNAHGHVTLRGRIDAKASFFLTKFVDHIIVKSYQMSKKVSRKRELSVVPNGVDLELFQPMDQKIARKHFNLHSKKKLILFAANPENPLKNYRLAREAVNILKDKVSRSFYLWGFFNQSQAELAIAMNAADIMVLCSFSEGSPNIVKEAMACNLPIVSVKVGDVPQLLANVKNCYLVDYDPTDMAKKLELVLRLNERSDGRNFIDHLRMDTVAKQIFEIYNHVMGKHAYR